MCITKAQYHGYDSFQSKLNSDIKQIYSIHSLSERSFKSFLCDTFLYGSSMLLALRLKHKIKINSFYKHSFFKSLFGIHIDDFAGKLLKTVIGQKQLIINQERISSSTSPIYGIDKINVQQNNKQFLFDPYFGVSVSSRNVIGLTQQVEYYDENDNNWKMRKICGYDYYRLSEKQNMYTRSYCWKNNTFDKWPSSKIFMPKSVKVGEYELNQLQYFNIAQKKVQLQIDQNSIEHYYSNLQGQADDQNCEGLELTQEIIKDHPFKEAQKSNKIIWFDKNYIYITKNDSSYSGDDIRISFHELVPSEEATVFTSLNKEANIQLGGKYSKITLGEFEIAKQGRISDKNELVKELIKLLDINHYNHQLIQQSSIFNGKEQNNKSYFMRILCILTFIYYLNFADRLELNTYKWGAALSANHFFAINLFKYGIINGKYLNLYLILPYTFAWILYTNQKNKKINNINLESSQQNLQQCTLNQQQQQQDNQIQNQLDQKTLIEQEFRSQNELQFNDMIDQYFIQKQQI
ncbi:hypothetical protein ABPG74_005247 [Tetrahymena malaccensis]